MAAVNQPWPLISLFLVSLFSVVHFSACQPNSPRNIETFYPFQPSPTPTSPILNSPDNPQIAPSSKSSSSNAVAVAVAATAASTILVAGLFFLLFQKYTVARGRSQKGGNDTRGGGEIVVSHSEFTRFNGNLRGLIVDENGLDVLYWKKFEGEKRKSSFRKEALQNLKDEEKRMSRNGDQGAKSEPIQEIPLLRRQSSTSYDEVQELENLNRFSAPPPLSQSSDISFEAVGKPESTIQSSTSPPPPPPKLAIPQEPRPPPPPSPPIPDKINPIPPPPPSPPILAKMKPIPSPPPSPPIPAKINPIPPPPPSPPIPAKIKPIPPPPPSPPIPAKINLIPPPPSSPPIPARIKPIPPPPPSPPIPAKINPIPPPPPSPPIPAKINPMPPQPPPSKAGGSTSSSKEASSMPKGMPSGSKLGESSSGYSKAGTGNGQVALKLLHWDKVNTNADHSMVWHKIDGGSFSFNDDLMEALFGHVATNGRSPQINHNNRNGASSSQSAQIFILDSRKSQNTAIVLRSLAIPRKEILDAVIEGEDLNADALEKLTKIAPTKEEESQILAFKGDPTRLADAESFLYHILKAVPSAFNRLSAMFFRSSYDPEILHLRECLQTLELGCKELRTCGLFLKLLEAILKAGNRMNAGTFRGNAQAFNLAALQKLSDIKSSDGKTTLLHFVVEEVVRSEGKRCVLNRDRSLSRSSNGSLYSENSASREDREKEYIMIGLPVVGGLSAEFSYVKKAAEIDYNAFAGVCSILTAHSTEIKQFLAQFANSDEGFLRKMKSFLEAAGEELREVREEQTRVMELVRRTTEYYQSRSSKNKEASPLQLFVIVKDFLGMVDQVCIDISRNLQRRKTTTASLGPSSTKSAPLRIPVKFPNLPPNFMSDKSRNSTSSDSEDEF